MTDRDKVGIKFDPRIHEQAKVWNSMDVMRGIEEPRYPFQRSIGKIVSDVFRQYVPEGSLVYEVGAGTGFLKDLVPVEYHEFYTSSDYNIRHLQEGLKRRKLMIQEANANSLPLSDQSVGTIVNLDAYDTLPDLQSAMNEVSRVLVPDGTFIHFQVNSPSEDTVIDDFTDYVFLPARIDDKLRKFNMVGIKREDLEKGLDYVKVPAFRDVVLRLLTDPKATFEILVRDDNRVMIDAVHNIVDAMPINRVTIPSVVDYFKTKLERNIVAVGLTIAESSFRSTVVRAERGKYNTDGYNMFSVETGTSLYTTNAEVKASDSNEVIEKATMLVVVAKKAA